jgi:predicted small secreted protein
VKLIAVVIASLGACLILGGCQDRLTLEEAQARCTKQGGFLVVIHAQKLTMSGIGPDIPSPGNCIAPSNFDDPAAKAATEPAKAAN